MAKKTKPNYSDTLIYANNKYVNKNMYMTDNEDVEVIEDEIIRTKKWQKKHLEKVNRLKQLGAPDVVVEHFEFLASMTFSQAMGYYAKLQKEHEAEVKKYREDNQIKEEYVKLIYERFDAWFEKYKDNEDVLSGELETGHYFFEPWFWGSHPPNAEKEFYEHIFTKEDWENEAYRPVFDVCENKIKKRLTELLPSEEKKIS